jgi:serine/threonine protein kinase
MVRLCVSCVLACGADFPPATESFRMAPEVVDNTGLPSPYDYKVDIWATGVTMIELAQTRCVIAHNLAPDKLFK